MWTSVTQSQYCDSGIGAFDSTYTLLLQEEVQDYIHGPEHWFASMQPFGQGLGNHPTTDDHRHNLCLVFAFSTLPCHQ